MTVAGVVAGLPACGDRDHGRILPEVDIVGGVEVATLRSIPDFRDPDFRWAFQVLREIPTVRPEDEIPLVFDPRSLLPLRDGTLLVALVHGSRF